MLQVPGGKGANQAVAAAKAAGLVSLIGAVGKDAFGELLRSATSAAGVYDMGLREVPESTGTALVTVDDAGQNTIVVVPGANATVTNLSAADRRMIAESDVLLLQLESPLSVVAEAAVVAHQAGARVVLTPAPVQPLSDQLLANVDLLVPNEREACQLSGCASYEQALDALLERVPAVAVTLGSRGCMYGDADGTRIVVPARSVAVVDTTAAGDTFTGSLAVHLAEGVPVPEALEWAACAAALSVRRTGAMPSMPTRQEIDEFARLRVAPDVTRSPSSRSET
jgi:ribokinase